MTTSNKGLLLHKANLKLTFLEAVYMRWDILPEWDIWFQQNGEFHFIKTNRLYEDEFISPKCMWDLTEVG